MSTAPSLVSPTDATMAVLSAGSGPNDSSAPCGAAEFLAAILQALGPEAGAVGEATAEDATPADPASPETDATGAEAAALGLVAPAGPMPQLVVSLPPVAPSTPVPGPANVAAGVAGAPAGPSRDIRMSGDDPTAQAPGDGETVGTTPPGAIASNGPASAGPHQHASADTPGLQAPAGTPQPTAPPVIAPSPAGAVPAAGHDAVGEVTRQVFPELTRLVSRGEGTHRITLTLSPEALGEVRVVMTVRDGAVHVRLAAGHDAQRSLIEGSPELARLLERVGATEARVVVRDLGGAPAATASDLFQGLGAGGRQPQDQHAGTRAHHPATDGTNDPGPTRDATRATPPRSVEPVTRTRTAGVDVTM